MTTTARPPRLLTLCAVLTVLLAAYCAVKLQRIVELAENREPATVSVVGSGGTDFDTEGVCKLLGAIAKKQGVNVTMLFLSDTTACARGAENVGAPTG